MQSSPKTKVRYQESVKMSPQTKILFCSQVRNYRVRKQKSANMTLCPQTWVRKRESAIYNAKLPSTGIIVILTSTGEWEEGVYNNIILRLAICNLTEYTIIHRHQYIRSTFDPIDNNYTQWSWFWEWIHSAVCSTTLVQLHLWCVPQLIRKYSLNRFWWLWV